MAKNTTNLISVDSLVFGDNVRTDACLNLPKMVESVKRHGYKVNHPLVVVKQGEYNLVLCGNRRGLALCWLRDNDPQAYAIAIPTGKVPAVVHEGLTPAEIVLLRIDHSSDEDREPLDQWSEFQAIRQLVLIGHDSQEKIAVQLGIFNQKGKNKGQPNRSYIQPRVNLAKLPEFVRVEMAKYCNEGPDKTPVKWSDLSSLYKAYLSEITTHPNGDGPALQEAWSKIMDRTPKVRGESADNGKSLTPSKAKDIVAACSSSLLKRIALALTGQGSETVTMVDAACVEAENALTQVGILKDHLGNTFNEVLGEAIAAKVDIAESAVV
jgi:hypothetical protein